MALPTDQANTGFKEDSHLTAFYERLRISPSNTLRVIYRQIGLLLYIPTFLLTHLEKVEKFRHYRLEFAEYRYDSRENAPLAGILDDMRWPICFAVCESRRTFRTLMYSQQYS